jgi:hypothetical protein
MDRLVVALDRGVGVSPAEFAAAWARDDEARTVGQADLGSSPHGEYVADVLMLVVIPLLVNISSSALYDLVRRIIARSHAAERESPSLELVEVTLANGDRILVVRSGSQS